MPIQEIQTNKQHAVPQNIMDVEFKLIGDLTMRQFVYLFVFFGLAYLFSITMVGLFRWPLVIFSSLLGLALAFLPIKERGLDEWIINFFKSVYSPAQRVWKKEAILPSVFSYQNIALVNQELITLAPTSSRRKLEEYLERQGKEQEVDELDIPEAEYIMKVREAYADYVPPAPVAAPTVTVVEELAPMPIEEPVVEPKPPLEKPQPVEPQPPKPEPKPKPEISPEDTMQKIPTAKPEQSVVQPEKKRLEPKPRPKKVRIIKRQPKVRKHIGEIPLIPMTPDMHSGRKFTNLLPSEGQLILPIRGERVIKTTEEQEIDKELEEKTKQLQKLLDNIKRKGYKPKVEAVPAAKVSTGPEPLTPADVTINEEIRGEEAAAKIQVENQRLIKEIDKVKRQLSQIQSEGGPTSPEDTKEKEVLLEKLKEKQRQASSDYAGLQKQILELQSRLKAKSPDIRARVIEAANTETKQLTNVPNVISGIVTDANGGTLPGVTLLVKNHKGEPVRALKTNFLGEFIVTTPLPNGTYTLEVSGSTVGSQTFDIISVEVKGILIPTIKVTGRVE
ncbi:carboxypeptidase regulatory-like domain-containing protein [Patescibacteria group bacterium]